MSWFIASDSGWHLSLRGDKDTKAGIRRQVYKGRYMRAVIRRQVYKGWYTKAGIQRSVMAAFSANSWGCEDRWDKVLASCLSS